MSNFQITVKWNILNGFNFKFPALPPPLKRLKNVLIESIPCVSTSMGEALIGEELTCQRERGNLVNPFDHMGNF